MRSFLQKHPYLSIVIFAVVFGLAKGAYEYYQINDAQSRLVDAKNQIVDATKELSNQQIALNERTVGATIKYMNSLAALQKANPSNEGSNSFLGSVFSRAEAVQESSSEHPNIWKDAGFKSVKEATSAMLSVVLAQMQIELETAEKGMSDAILRVEGSLKDRALSDDQRKRVDKQKRVAELQMNLFREVIDNINLIDGNYALVKARYVEIKSAFGRFK